MIDYQLRLAEIDTQRLNDSIVKAALEEQLKSLKTTDNLKKEELQQQLEALNQKDAKRILAKKAQIDSLRHTVKSFPVLGLFNDTLFSIYSKLGSFSAKARAAAITERINNLAHNFSFKNDTLQLLKTESTVDIVSGEEIIMSISEDDALWNNLPAQQLAEQLKATISTEIKHYKKETSLITLAEEVALAFLVLLVVGLVIFYLNKLFRFFAQKIKAQENKRLNGFQLKNYTLFDASRQVNVLLSANTFLKWITILLSLYIALPILFGIFPWTQNFAEQLFGYILTPVKKIAFSFWNFLPNLITIAVIIIVFRYVLRGIHFLKQEIEDNKLHLPGFYPDWANPTYQIVKVLVYAFMVVVIFPYLPGSDSPVFQGVSVFLGFLFTFGSAGSLSNIIAGLVLTYMRLFKIGDRVKIGEVVGDVIEKSMLVTRVRTTKNEIISIPNSTVMSSHTINYSSDAPEKGLILHTTVTLGYDVPWKKVHKTLVDAALRTPNLLQEPIPFVLQTSLDDFYVSYQLNAYTREPNLQSKTYSDLHQNIQDACNENDIEILSPHYRAERDGNQSTIPSDYLGKDYKAPGFNVNVKKEA